MARLEIRNIRKTYPGVTALDDICLDVRSGEFFTLLGPSGCGKTTLLRTIAGFNTPDRGEIVVEGRRVDDVPAHRRDVGMVYQDYAIFPHMTVADNIGFGLVMRRRPREEIKQRVARALELVQLTALAGRQPHQLSGGQQQRVALARAMVINPQILLMDEPLSNLDAKLRIDLREEIRDLQRSLGITTIYVTHDQEEALVISDRVCVMHDGRVHQVGTPQEIYRRPATLFVASFVGAMNVMPETAVGPRGELSIAGAAHVLPALAGRSRAILAIRPEDVLISARPPAAGQAISFGAVVQKTIFAGREAYFRLAGASDLAVLALVHRPDPAQLAEAGARLTIGFPFDRLHAFDPADGRRIELSP